MSLCCSQPIATFGWASELIAFAAVVARGYESATASTSSPWRPCFSYTYFLLLVLFLFYVLCFGQLSFVKEDWSLTGS